MNTTASSPKCPRCGAAVAPGSPESLCPRCLLALNLESPTQLTGEASARLAGQPPPPTLEEVAKLFPQLEIVRLLGQGGMGAVYLARQPGLDRLVALKILTPPSVAGRDFAERFIREARALAKLSHPNIVAVHDFGEVSGRFYLLMEFVDGVTLRELLSTQKLPAAEALAIVPKICDALQFAHEHGIVHRDIKPENVLLDKQGRVKIADFGIAKLLGETNRPGVALTGAQDQVGTPHYMAPEQVEQPQTVDHRADIFSLGVVFYEMLTGELPLGRFAAPSQRVQVDVRLDEIVLHALEKEPGRRYQHASEVRTAVETVSGDPDGKRTAAPTPPPVSAPAFGGTVPSLSSAEAAALTDELLARDYELDIGSCFSRSWALIKANFWPMIGVTALVLALLGAASGSSQAAKGGSNTTSVLFLLIDGPLMGGLSLYYLRKIRGQATSVELVFAGFTQRFLQLFLGGFVTLSLIGLGFLCLVLPGIYLFVAWLFTLTLIVDKRLDFWPAMQLSRRMVAKHWWKVFGLVLLSLLLSFLGLLALVVGLFVATPIGWLAATYAYEDMFGTGAGEKTATV